MRNDRLTPRQQRLFFRSAGAFWGILGFVGIVFLDWPGWTYAVIAFGPLPFELTFFDRLNDPDFPNTRLGRLLTRRHDGDVRRAKHARAMR
jgi:hypothetical protein